MRIPLIVSAILATSVALPAAAQASSVTLNAGQQTTRSGHLIGLSPAGLTVAPYSPGVPEVCTPNACDAVQVTVHLPKGTKRGKLSVLVSAPTQGAGLNVRIFNSAGKLIAGATGGGVGVAAPVGDTSVGAVRDAIPPGTYTVRIYLAAGIADFKEQLTWRSAK